MEKDIELTKKIINDSINNNILVDRDIDIIFKYDFIDSNNVNLGDAYNITNCINIRFIAYDSKSGEYLGDIKQLTDTIKITIKLDGIIADEKSNFIYIAKLHNDNVEFIKVDITSNGSYLSFSTSQFSIFAIVSSDSSIIDYVSKVDNNSVNFSDLDNNKNDLLKVEIPKEINSNSELHNKLIIKNNRNKYGLKYVLFFALGTIIFILNIYFKKRIKHNLA